jgi:hypothetical protein
MLYVFTFFYFKLPNDDVKLENGHPESNTSHIFNWKHNEEQLGKLKVLFKNA